MIEMQLKKVELHADVYMTCMQHALSTENYEVMGLLIGNSENGIANISAVVILKRLDKKKDRVEISDEQLLKAAADAERLASELNRPMRVIDVGTQATYQTMDAGFVGLIFSVFSEAKDTKEQEVVVTCFQSHNNKSIEIPLEIIYEQEISELCLNTMVELPKILVEEEEKSCGKHPDILASILNDAVKTRALIHITDTITKPLLQTFENRIKLNKIRAEYLRKQLSELKTMNTN
ncbi:lys-63-specific deubiquitinase BRCC36-like isoform X2 [Aphidius gifuensis]|uniref:lys-63-specific deubiquitinase BRCC36-like isoform X2 n=1 Tax=Aphidius gifuensis TaxID=684658 RepID=UPI001CDCB4C3|nr:lys-63-specific deubiquitinase BRCC36-like isoform X2 [Aphidius gifuensis]